MKFSLLFGAIIFVLANCLCCKKDVGRNAKDLGDTIAVDSNYSEHENFEAAVLFNDMLGINGFDWDYTKENSNDFDDEKLDMIKIFTGFRQYLDWEKVEPTEGSFNFTHYDKIYRKNHELGINTLVCLQIMPGWMRRSYPEYNISDAFSSLRDYTPIPQGSNKTMPSSYIAMAKAGFQFAARYGSNSSIDRTLVRGATWEVNPLPIALNTVKYIECSNEPDKTWRGPHAYQTPEEYAAQLSAFYDGHLGTLGRDVGVKSADPNFKVVMAGLADPDPNYVKRMIDWCKINRVKNGSYSLCFDIINYHHYSNQNLKNALPPEASDVASIAEQFVSLSKEAGGKDVWVTECGFDINPSSPQSAIAISAKSTSDTQADWLLRTALLYARSGVKKTFFFMLNDVNLDDATQYSSSGLFANKKRRPSADFLYQSRKLMDGYHFQQCLSKDPFVDQYISGKKIIYIITVPDKTNRKLKYNLRLDKSVKSVTIYIPQANSDKMRSEIMDVKNEQVVISATETPTFVKVN